MRVSYLRDGKGLQVGGLPCGAGVYEMAALPCKACREKESEGRSKREEERMKENPKGESKESSTNRKIKEK